jgi:GDPmannose 4,6-dehydratase
MWLMLQQDEPDDYVLATNETHTVREFVERAFACVDLDWKKYVRFDKRYERPAEVDLLIGNPGKAKKQLGWEPNTRFEQLVEIMVEADLEATKEQVYGLKAKQLTTEVASEADVCNGVRVVLGTKPIKRGDLPLEHTAKAKP